MTPGRAGAGTTGTSRAEKRRRSERRPALQFRVQVLNKTALSNGGDGGSEDRERIESRLNVLHGVFRIDADEVLEQDER